MDGVSSACRNMYKDCVNSVRELHSPEHNIETHWGKRGQDVLDGLNKEKLKFDLFITYIVMSHPLSSSLASEIVLVCLSSFL